MENIIKFIMYCFAAFCFFSFVVATCSDDKESDNQKIESNKQSEEIEEKKENSFLGTYKITDKVGCTIHLTLNEDETATITGVRGEGITYYCSWFDSSYGEGKKIHISFSDDKPILVYEGGIENNKYNYEGLYLKDGWLYSGNSNAESKNPKWRLKATKIK